MTPTRIAATIVAVVSLATLALLSLESPIQLPGKPFWHVAGFTLATLATLVISTSFARTGETVAATAAWVYIGVSIIAIMLEVAQSNRFGGLVEKGDVAANLCGCALGVVAWLATRTRRRYSRRTP